MTRRGRARRATPTLTLVDGLHLTATTSTANKRHPIPRKCADSRRIPCARARGASRLLGQHATPIESRHCSRARSVALGPARPRCGGARIPRARRRQNLSPAAGAADDRLRHGRVLRAADAAAGGADCRSDKGPREGAARGTSRRGITRSASCRAARFCAKRSSPTRACSS